MARVAIGRTGRSEPLAASLDFRMAHAHARDAVFAPLDIPTLKDALLDTGATIFILHSKAADRRTYLQRPDLGRKLSENSIAALQASNPSPSKIVWVLADGLSATALQKHAAPFMKAAVPLLEASGFETNAVCIVEQGRVAIGDEIAALLQARLVIVLIGERPGLSAADSLGLYLTYHPLPGTTDEARNCISNIRSEGMPYSIAAEKLLFLVKEAFRLQLSGVMLKDHSSGLISE